jgi:hypothetical protein
MVNVQISVNLLKPLAPKVVSRTARLTFALPPGTQFLHCVSPACKHILVSFWTENLTFGPGITRKTVSYSVKAQTFGVAFNGVNAFAAIPTVSYAGAGTSELIILYQIPSASNYDWSSYPAFLTTKSSASWQIPLVRGATAGRIATGINHVSQTSNDNRTFFAGALLGLAGGAILSAVQEALHAND